MHFIPLFSPREEVVCAVSIQRERFQLAGPPNAKARECCDLVILSLYVFIPPSRGLEIRTDKLSEILPPWTHITAER